MIGIGMDLCEIARMEKLLLKNDAFLKRYFTAEEQAYILSKGKGAAQSMAAIFAAKEALFKAMGTGVSGHAFTEVLVLHNDKGQPYYSLQGAAAKTFAALGAQRAHLSLTHEAGVAGAVAILE